MGARTPQPIVTLAISVVLPVFNAEPTVERAIASVRAQTFLDWELLVIDDGSTDNTPSVTAAAAVNDSRIRVMSRPHEGLVAALNSGIAAARGALIARMDADDESHPERLAEQRAAFEREPELGLVGCLVEFGGDRTANAGYALHVDWINSLVTPEEIALNRFVESPFAHPSVMFRRELVERFGGYRAGDFPEDYELWLRWIDAGVRTMKVPRPLLRWNDPPARLSRTDPRYSPEAFFRTKALWIARELLRRAEHGESRPLWIWGAGRPTRKRAAHLKTHGLEIAGYIDVDPKKTGRTLAGLPILSPAEIPSPDKAFVLGYVSSRGARDLIRSTLVARNFTEGRDFLMCA